MVKQQWRSATVVLLREHLCHELGVTSVRTKGLEMKAAKTFFCISVEDLHLALGQVK